MFFFKTKLLAWLLIARVEELIVVFIIKMKNKFFSLSYTTYGKLRNLFYRTSDQNRYFT